MSQPSRRNPPRERRSALEEALYYFNGEGISSPELNASNYDVEDSDDTLPSREPMRVEERYEPAPSDRLANLDRAVALLIQHSARLSRKMDIILNSNRRLHGRLRELETKITHRNPAPEATPLPQNSIKRAMKTAADFKQLNNLLEDNEVRNQLLVQQSLVWHGVELLLEANESYVDSVPVVESSGPGLERLQQVCRAGSSFPEPMLAFR
ncbi:hypothetical protein SprV_0100463200 [Sparganum proliferum]